MNGLLVAGTASDVGKTMICTALCRILANEGVRVAPFKSQNMSGYSVTLPDGREISRSVFQQAEAARTEAIAEMNPILLKPKLGLQSDVLLLGKRLATVSGQDFREQFFEQGITTIKASLAHLSQQYDTVILEGAGSTAEVNLMDRELTNMRAAELADVPVLLVADISKGGAIASIVGTLQLLTEERRARVKAILINQFYGDVEFFRDGIDFIEQYTGLPVAGVIPVLADHGIPEEDMDRSTMPAADGIDVYEQWADHVRQHIDWPLIRSILA